jgi:hypothetical protein
MINNNLCFPWELDNDFRIRALRVIEWVEFNM